MSGDHFSGHAADYARYRPDYPLTLFEWLAGQCDGHSLAWDCGTGNGQAAHGLAAHFARVVATDLSAEQVARGRPHPRITYRAAPAEASGLDAASCDHVTVAQALHWFCHDGFYAEVDRVLKPGGVFAAWTYTLLRSDPEINAAVAHFHDTVVGPWWPPERRWVDVGYAGMPFPYPAIAAPAFEIRLDWTLADLLAYLRTWSATQRCLKETGSDPTLALGDILQPLWGSPERARTIVWPIALLCGRKP